MRRSGFKIVITLFTLFFFQISNAQIARITGVVTGNDDEPLPNVTIRVKGKSASLKSDNKGAFSVTAVKGDSLIFTSVGYKAQSVFVSDTRTLTVRMETAVNSLEDVVVIGYGTRKKSDLTGAVSGVKAKDIEQSRNTDLLSSMQGKVAGARIFSQSGEPGAAINVQIRGISSLYGSSSPLYVIDGVPYDVNANEVAISGEANLGYSSNPLNTLNPADIEAIDVLKDASATAIYGSRGANGVVIITTKSGKSGRSITTYDGYVSFAKATKSLDMLYGNEFIEYQRLVNPQSSLFYNNSGPQGTINLNDPRDPYALEQHDWQAEMIQTAISQNHNIAISGGSEKTTFAGGIGFLNEEGIIRNNNQKRYSIRLKVDHQASKKIKLGLNFNTAYTDMNGATNTGQANAWNGIIQNIISAKPIAFFDSDFDETVGFVTPLSIIDNAYKNVSSIRSTLNGYTEIEILRNLKLNISGGGILSSSKGKEFYSRLTPLGNANNGVGILQENRSISWYNTNRLTYQYEVNANHKFDIMGAFETNGYVFENMLMRSSDFADESTGIDDISKGAVVNRLNSEKWVNNRLSWLGRFNYTYMDKYLFTASFRADGSDKFGAGNKYGYFPSLAVAWKANQEVFLRDADWLSELKVRLSYGQTGNERIPAYSYAGKMNNTFYSSGGISTYGVSPSTLANRNLKWENTTQYNAGLDLGVLDNRFSITLDLYNKRTNDMLLPVLIPSQSGYEQQWQNIGRIDNSGWEIQLTSQNIRSADLQWTTNFNISQNFNEIKSLGTLSYIPVIIDNGVISNIGRVSVGQSLGTAYGYVSDGIYQIDQFNWQNNSDASIPHAQRTYSLRPGEVDVAGVTVQPGSYRFRDLNKDGMIDDLNDRTFISNSLPKHFGGINNTISYKGFELNVFFEWSYGGEIFNLGKIAQQGLSVNSNISREYLNNKWTPENPSNEYPDFRSANGLPGGNTSFRLSSSYYVEDASYLRLKNLSLNYNLPRKWISALGLTSGRVYVTGNNLLLFTDYTGYDPDVSFDNPLFSGLDRITYPRSKSFIAGVSISF